MKEVYIWLALKDHIEPKILIDVVQPTAQLKLDPAKPYAILSLSPLDVGRPVMANDEYHVYTGIMQVSLMTPIEWTQAQVLGAAAKIVDSFKEADKPTYNGVQVRLLRRGTIEPIYRDDTHWRTPINFYYRAAS